MMCVRVCVCAKLETVWNNLRHDSGMNNKMATQQGSFERLREGYNSDLKAQDHDDADEKNGVISWL